MGSSASKDLPYHNSPLRTGILTENTNYSTGVAGSPIRKKSAIVYREKSLQQLPTTAANTFIENVFLISAGSAVGDGLPEQCILVSETARKSDIQLLTANNVEQAVHERILSHSRGSVIVKSDSSISQCKLTEQERQEKDESFDDTCVFKYLYHCFLRWKACQRSEKFTTIVDDIKKCKDVIFLKIKVCLEKPEMFTGQQIHQQFIDVCIWNKDSIFDKESHIQDFLIQLFAILESERGCMMTCLSPVLTYIRQRFKTELKLIDSEEIRNLMLVLRVFTLKASAAYMLMDFSAPTDWNKAICYEDTLIGSILSMNTCPKTDKGPYEFFNDPIDMPWEDVGKVFKIIWQRVAEVCEELYQVLIGCIRLSEDLRHVVLDWFGRCLEANRGKPDIWSAHEVEVFDTPYCSDGFCLNLCQVLLQMCQHFSEPNNQRLLQIKPAYCRATPQSELDRRTMCVHARGLEKETPFVPYTEDSALPQFDVYHYTSDCFFLTHQALHIGYSVVFKLLKLNCNVLRLEKLYKEIKDKYPPNIVERVKQQLNREACWCLNLKAAISQQHLTMRCLQFNIATASWLVQVASSDNVTVFKPVKLPLDSNVPKSLSYLPQYIITNLTQFIAPLKIFRTQDLLTALYVVKKEHCYTFDNEHLKDIIFVKEVALCNNWKMLIESCNKTEINNADILEHHITLMLVFIGRPDRLTSPDVRAQLSEGLEYILPRLNEDGSWATTKSGNTEKLFNEHPLIEHLAETILALFVGIEMTDQNVDDEKKYGYRSSVHRVIQYIWRIPLHKKAIKRLSEEAVSAIGNPEPPLFLRFINLLINDAIFLLDEALDYMKQIRVYEMERDSGKWNKLRSVQFRDKESELQGLVVGGRSRNVMANHTLYTLELLTEEIREIFCHHVMVDRLAGMLNYFLEHLVGPKQSEYNVKGRKEYEFKPEQLVSDIAHIYVYLGQDEHFCKAVLGESRSFSANLFPQAMTVLQKIGVSEEFIRRFEGLSVKLKSMEVDHKLEEEVIAEAPEEFLDPIMGTLMVDPVKLPTSNTSMDRAVIARHLLSDQRDPFTNLPLSMDMVTTNSELKKKIEEWKMSHIKRPV